MLRTDPQAAIELYKKELEQHPKNNVALGSLAQAYMNLQDYPNAKATLDKVLAMTETNASTNGMLGVYHLRTGNVEEAAKTFRQTLELNYKYYLASYYLALIHQQKGDLNKAIEYVEECRKTAGRFKPVYQLGAQLYQQKGDAKTAQQYQQVLNSL